jgi:hypothetical protein
MSRRPSAATPAPTPPTNSINSWMPQIAAPAGYTHNMYPQQFTPAYMQQPMQQQHMYNPQLTAPMPSVVDFNPGVIHNLQQVATHAPAAMYNTDPQNMNEQIFHHERVRSAVHQAVSSGITDYDKRHKCDISDLKSQLSAMRSRERHMQRKLDADAQSKSDRVRHHMDPPAEDTPPPTNPGSRSRTRSTKKTEDTAYLARERRYEVARAMFEAAKEERDSVCHM